MTSRTKLKNDGERMVPELHEGALIYAEHLIRYRAAQELCRGKIVLDIASGSGYGTKLLAEQAKKVYGVDVNKKAIQYSQETFGAKNIEYKVGDGESIPLEDNSVDIVITFETIEHIKDYKQFLREVKRVLRPDGLAIVSTPNDLEFAEGNHFHLHEFQYKELYDLLKKDYKFIDPYFQATWKYVALGSSDLFNKKGQVNIENLNLAPLDEKQYLYFYLVCSNKQITKKIENLGAIGEHYSDRNMQALSQEKEEIFRVLKETQASHDNLSRRFEDKEDQLKAIQEELDEIRASKAYKTAVKVGNLKHKITRK